MLEIEISRYHVSLNPCMGDGCDAYTDDGSVMCAGCDRRAHVRRALADAATIAPYLTRDPDDLTIERHAGSYTTIGYAVSLTMMSCETLHVRACCCCAARCYCPLRRIETSPETLQATYEQIYGRTWEDVPAIGIVEAREYRSTLATVV